MLSSSLESMLRSDYSVLRSRLTARLSFTEWAIHKGFKPAKHHRLIMDQIEAFLNSSSEKNPDAVRAARWSFTPKTRANSEPTSLVDS